MVSWNESANIKLMFLFSCCFHLVQCFFSRSFGFCLHVNVYQVNWSTSPHIVYTPTIIFHVWLWHDDGNKIVVSTSNSIESNMYIRTKKKERKNAQRLNKRRLKACDLRCELETNRKTFLLISSMHNGSVLYTHRHICTKRKLY